jgi:dihydrofolate synthase/folylpolyglutamate synthase
LDEKLGQTTFEYRDQTWSLPLTGRFQRDNALTALEAVSCLTEKGFVIDKKAMQEGLAAATIPCRQEVIQRNPLIFMDGAHNPHGVTALCDTLRRHLPDQKITAVIGMLSDKDTATCAAMLAPLCAHIVCCTPNHVRALSAARLAEQMREDCADVLAVDSPQEALRIAQKKAGDFPLMIAGSFYVCAVLRPLLL